MVKRYIPKCRRLTAKKVRRKRLKKKARQNFTVQYTWHGCDIVFDNVLTPTEYEIVRQGLHQRFQNLTIV